MTHVHIVSYLDDVHIYADQDGNAARMLHTVAIGANTESVLYRVTTQRWEGLRVGLADVIDGEIIDHRPTISAVI
jgi:hypothetical protein